MVVAPEAIVESFLSIGSSIMSSHLPNCIILLLNFIGCAPSAPDGSGPEAIRGCLQPDLDSSIFLHDLYFLHSDKPLLLSFIVSHCFLSLLDGMIKPVM
jgi:hypothetical protein